jgi:molybdate transport system ATP-binding protein
MEASTIAVVGLNASGKTMLAERLRREYSSDSVRYVAFCDSYGTSTDRGYYLQQRWNQHDIDSETPSVADVIERSFLLSGSDTPERRELQRSLIDTLGIGSLLNQYIIALSSGELRKVQMLKTLMARPRVIILDNPFIGLDTEARQLLNELLLQLKKQGIKVYLLVSRRSEIPEFADEIIWTTPEEYFNKTPLSTHVYKRRDDANGVNSPEVIRLNDVTVGYSGHTILDRLSWTVRKGEHWALTGRNGSGKSTLLSLICADNPQSYACDISLFGHQRGSGESIWDIKRNIGYVSPEMHRSYQRDIPALNIVASGIKDTIGLYVKPTAQEKELCQQWMSRFGIDELADRSFMRLSSGEQRLLLVCRAFVKSPALLVLDEPMHGLDLVNQQKVKDIIDEYCEAPQHTLIMVTHYEEELPQCIDHRLRL